MSEQDLQVIDCLLFVQNKVGAKAIPDYHEWVPVADVMFLGKIENNIRRHLYKSSAAFRTDFQQILNNAVAYNTAGHGQIGFPGESLVLDFRSPIHFLPAVSSPAMGRVFDLGKNYTLFRVSKLICTILLGTGSQGALEDRSKTRFSMRDKPLAAYHFPSFFLFPWFGLLPLPLQMGTHSSCQRWQPSLPYMEAVSLHFKADLSVPL